MTDDETVRAGVVGVGSMGRNHARVYRELAGVELVGVADRDASVAGRVATEYGTRARAQDALLADVDVATVAVPTSAHVPVVDACIDAGVDVLVEKPFVADVERGRRLADRARAAGVTVQVGHVERFNPAVRTLLDIADDLDVIAVDAQRLGPPPGRDIETDVALDLMIHDIDVLRALLDEEPSTVCAAGTADGEYASATFGFDDGVVASLTASRVTQRKVRRLGVTARDRRVCLDYIDQSVAVHRGAAPAYIEEDGDVRQRLEGVVERPVVENGEPLKAELSSFVEAVREGRDPVVTAEDGLRAVELAQRVAGLAADGARTEVAR